MTVLRVEGFLSTSTQRTHPCNVLRRFTSPVRCYPESSRDLSKLTVFLYSDDDSIMSVTSRIRLGVKVRCNKGALRQARSEERCVGRGSREQIDPSKNRDDSTES